MSKITYIKGDLLETDAPVIAHGCNCQGVMGSGVALQIKEKYPEVYNYYKGIHERRGLELGEVQFVEHLNGKTVVNAMTQKYYGRDRTTVYVDYRAIRTCMKRIANYNYDATIGHRSVGDMRIAMPKIGSDRGGGDWGIIESIIEEELCDKGFGVYVYYL